MLKKILDRTAVTGVTTWHATRTEISWSSGMFSPNWQPQSARHPSLDGPPKAQTQLPGYRTTSRECGLCHGETGIGELEGMPVLTGQDPRYITHALAAYRSGERSDPTMSRVAKAISPTDDAAVAEFHGSHPWLEHGK